MNKDNQIKRIKKNEIILDKTINVINKLNKDIDELINLKKDIMKLNNYYGSKEWYQDINDYDSKKIFNIKAGVLSEDAIWNMNEDLKELTSKMSQIKFNYENK